MKHFLSFCLFLSLASFSFSLDWHSPYKAPPVTPPEHVHPRLMFRDSDLAQIRTNMKSPEESTVYALFQNDPSNLSKSVSFVPLKNKTYTFDSQVLSHIENASLHYALEKNTKYVSFAYESFISCCNTMNTDGIYDTYRPQGQLILTAAELYDWCYDALSAKQKKEIINRALNAASFLQIGCPPSKQGAVVGHGSEAQLLRAYIALAIAVYDERPEIWNYVAGRFYEEYVPARLFYYKTGVPSFQGSNYGPYRTIFDSWSALLIMRMGAENPYGTSFANWNDAFLYYQRPDGQMWRIGDDTGERHKTYELSTYADNAFFSSAVSGNPFVKQFASSFYKGFTFFKYNTAGESDDHFTPAQFIIFNNPSVKPVPYDSPDSSSTSKEYAGFTLPLARYNKSPMGEYFARGSWSDSSTPAVHMKIGELNSGNHEHRDGGSFELFCGGILASDSGFYTSGGGPAGYSAAEVKLYLHGTIAHNCLLVEPASATAEDYGGQKTVDEPGTLKSWLAEKNDVRGTVTAHADSFTNSQHFAYLAGDLTNAYEHADYVHRSMLAVFTGNSRTPLLFFVYDSVTPKKDARAVFLLHMQSEPSIEGNTIQFSSRLPDEKSSGEQNNNSARSYSNLVCTTLLPANAQFTKLGGPGKEFMIARKNYEPAITVQPEWVAEQGWGRIEIRNGGDNNSAKNSNASGAITPSVFLNAMAVNRISENAHSSDSAILLSAENFDGAYLYNTAVFFARKAEACPLGCDIPENAQYLYVCNILPGEYTVTEQSVADASQDALSDLSSHQQKEAASIHSEKITVTDEGKILAYKIMYLKSHISVTAN